MSQLLMLSYPLLAGMLASLIISYIGVYVVLRRNVFIGLALPQIAGLGLAFGFLLNTVPLLFSILFILIGVVYFSFSHQNKIIPLEAVIGLAYILAASLSILFISHSPKGQDEILNILFGNILIVSLKDILYLLGVMLIAFFVLIRYHKKFVIISYDSDLAMVQKINTQFWNFLFYFILGLIISISIKIVGSLLVFALLVLPAMFGLLFSKTFKNLFIFSILYGLITTIFGVFLSFYFDLPTGPFIVALLGTLLLIFYVIKRNMGQK